MITRFPVGLLLYWMTTNLWTIGQGIVTRRLTPSLNLHRSVRPGPRRRRAGDGGNGAEPAQAPKPRPPPAAAGPPRRVKRKKRKGGR